MEKKQGGGHIKKDYPTAKRFRTQGQGWGNRAERAQKMSSNEEIKLSFLVMVLCMHTDVINHFTVLCSRDGK